MVGEDEQLFHANKIPFPLQHLCMKAGIFKSARKNSPQNGKMIAPTARSRDVLIAREKTARKGGIIIAPTARSRGNLNAGEKEPAGRHIHSPDHKVAGMFDCGRKNSPQGGISIVPTARSRDVLIEGERRAR
jgi:hypothetical protein